MASLEPAIAQSTSVAMLAALDGLEQGGVDAGMPQQSARDYARQALLGTTLLMDDLAESPARLKDLVTSPGGTTIVGLAALEDRGVRGVLLRMVQGAAGRAAKGGDK